MQNAVYLCFGRKIGKSGRVRTLALSRSTFSENLVAVAWKLEEELAARHTDRQTDWLNQTGLPWKNFILHYHNRDQARL